MSKLNEPEHIQVLNAEGKSIVEIVNEVVNHNLSVLTDDKIKELYNEFETNELLEK